MLRPLPRLLVLPLLLSACTLAKIDVNVVGERTSLENQVLGSYNSLSEEVLLVASVRGVSPTGQVSPAPQRTPEQAEAVQALETLAFHADDLDAFKRLGWVGENNAGTLTPFARDVAPGIPQELRDFAAGYGSGEFEQVLAEINRAREVLMLRVVRTNENFTSADLPAIRRVFARINRESSPPGTRVQNEDGGWTTP